MKHFACSFFVSAVLVFAAGSCMDNKPAGDGWPEITKETKPWTRWWWLGSDVDQENLGALLGQYAESGFGGVEITPIYGVQGREDHYLDFLSPQWMEMLKTCVAEAERLGMGVDMNLGTGWPFGGPQITPEYAASRLIVQKYALADKEPLPEKILPRDPRQVRVGAYLEALTAYGGSGEILDLTDSVAEDGTLNWIPPDGRWELYAAFCGKTRQRVKRAAPGGEGYTLNHFSKEALDVYLARFDTAFGHYRGVRCFFNDSYEVYNASWSPGFFDEFHARRGYDLRKYIRELSTEEDTELTARLKSDYRETMSELLLENFTQPWTSWSNARGSLTRNQAHGSPGNLIDLYAAVDIPECEIFGHRDFDIPGLKENTDDTRNVEPDPMMLKLATSAAHVTGKAKISNETFTWLGEHFKVALSQCKPEVEEAFLAGINHVFYHGTTYSPLDARWPGWLFYASVNFAPSNSFWPHVGGLNQYITNCQRILQSGAADNEVLVYWPIQDIWHDARGLEMQLTVHNIREWLEYQGIEKMTAGGYSYDFISDVLLQELRQAGGGLHTGAGTAYDVLVVPACRFIPLETLDKILSLARAGSTVVFEDLPGDVPGLHQLEERRGEFGELLGGLDFEDAGEGIRESRTGKGRVILCGDLARALEYTGIQGERIGRYGLKFTRRAAKDGKYYYLVNHTPEAVDEWIPLNARAGSVLILDPQDGSSGKARMKEDAEGIRVRVQLLPGKSLFLRTLPGSSEGAADWIYEEKRLAPVELQGDWELAFVSGGPQLPGAEGSATGDSETPEAGTISLEGPLPWTELEIDGVEEFSGTAQYTLRFNRPEVQADEFILDLGKVYESARVNLNGHDLGIAWSVPFEMKAGAFLQDGENTLVIEVANLMANRIRYMDRQEIPWRIFHEINFVNIEYGPFDASDWEVQPSGLGGPVRLIPIETSGGPGLPEEQSPSGE